MVHVVQANQQDGDQRQMVVRIPGPLYERVQAIARTEQRTLSAEVRWLMERRVRERENELREAA